MSYTKIPQEEKKLYHCKQANRCRILYFFIALATKLIKAEIAFHYV